MNSIIELNNNLFKLEKNERVKIDIHFVISEPLRGYCEQINFALENANNSFVKISPISINVPHVTLFMGYVNNYENLEKIFKKVYLLSAQINKFDCIPKKPYFKGVSITAPQYLFIPLVNSKIYQNYKLIMEKELCDCTIPLEWDIKKEEPHITVGCYKSLNEGTTNIIDNIELPPQCNISQIGISITGNRGTCLGHLKTYELQ